MGTWVDYIVYNLDYIAVDFGQTFSEIYNIQTVFLQNYLPIVFLIGE
jgi:hypothetical protein